MALASGIFKRVIIADEAVAWGTAGAGPGQYLRRVESTLDLSKDPFESAEIRASQQQYDFRHGVRRVSGGISAELAPASHTLMLASLFRNNWATAATTGALTDVTAAAGPPGTFTRGSGSFITDGFKVGDIVRWSGWATTGATNNARNYRITALTATVMTVTGTLDEVVGAKAAGDSVTCVVTGKKLTVPATGQLDKSFTIEHWFADISRSELFTGCKTDQMAFSLPPTALATASAQVIGKDMTAAGSANYSSPNAAPTTTALAGVNGILRLNGTDVAIVTGAQFSIMGNLSAEPVLGSTTVPAIFLGRLRAQGSFTAFFEDATIQNLFINETEADLHIYLKSSNAINSSFICFKFGRIKVNSANKNDGERGIQQSCNFIALEDAGGSSNEDLTTVTIQDSDVT